jgi:hypothetical protein
MGSIATVRLLLVLGLLGAGQPNAGPVSIAGRVVDSESGAPIAEARVLLYIPTPTPDGVALVPHETRSDKGGAFQYVGIAPGRYQISVLKEDYIRSPALPPSVFADVAGDVWPVEVVYELRRSAVISGRVFDRAGYPAERATVVALHARPGVRGFKHAAPGVQTDRHGRFRLTELDEGEYLIRASLTESGAEHGAPDNVPVLAYYPGTADATAARSITVGVAQILNAVDFGLATQALFELSGVVLRGTGEPVAAATVLVTPNHSGAEPPISVPDRVKTAADGSFVVRLLARGDYLVRAAAALVSPSDDSDRVSSQYMASSPIAEGGPLVRETAGGLTFEYRFDPTGMAVSVRTGDISGIRLVVR